MIDTFAHCGTIYGDPGSNNHPIGGFCSSLALPVRILRRKLSRSPKRVMAFGVLLRDQEGRGYGRVAPPRKLKDRLMINPVTSRRHLLIGGAGAGPALALPFGNACQAFATNPASSKGTITMNMLTTKHGTQILYKTGVLRRRSRWCFATAGRLAPTIGTHR